VPGAKSIKKGFSVTAVFDRFTWLRRLDRTSVVCVGLLIILPAMLLVFNRAWVFTSTGTLDPWIYAGYQMHPTRLWHEFPTAYYGSRVPWILFGWTVHRIAGPEASLYILALTLFYVSTFSLYYAIRRTFDNAIAGFAIACLLGTNSWFLWAIGWDYIDGPMIALILLSLAAITGTAKGRRWRVASVLFGAATAATIALFTPNLYLLPIFAGMFLGLNYFGSRRPILTVALLWGAGFVMTFLALCLATWALGGTFLFFMAQVGASFNLLSLRSAMPSWSAWFWSAPWLLVPAFAFLTSLALLAVRGASVLSALRRDDREPAISVGGNLLVIAAGCVVLTLGFAFMEAMHLGMLLVSYHANELYPNAFLVFGACLAATKSRMQKSYPLSIATAAVALSLAPWALRSLPRFNVPLSQAAQTIIYAPFLVFSGKLIEPLWMAAGAALVLGTFLSRKVFVPIGMIGFMSLVGATTLGYSSISGAEETAMRNRALSLYDIAGIIDKVEPQRRLPIWWEKSDPLWPLLVSLGEMMYIEWDPLHRPPTVAPGDRLIFLSSNGTLSATEEHLLKRQHLSTVPVVQQRVQRGAVGIDVAIADIVLSRADFHRVGIPLSGIKSPPSAGDRFLRVETPPGPWTNAAIFRVPEELKRRQAGGGYVRVRFRVETGTVGVGITTKADQAWIDRKFFPSSPGIREVYLAVPAFSNTDHIVFCNGGDGTPSIALVYSAEALYRRR
jgi:hypothetical protein